MKKLLVVCLLCAIAAPAFGYPKTALVERFTNASCGPCATVNAAWYVDTVQDLEDQDLLNHIVYNVNWPGATDPMYLLNAADNMMRRSVYGVNSVPWIETDGVTFNITGNTVTDRANMINTVTNIHDTGYAPFDVAVDARIYAGDVIDVVVTVTRDPADASVLPAELVLQIGLVEDVVTFPSPPGTNGETVFHDVCRKMLNDALGTAFAVPAPGGSIDVPVTYVPSAEALAAVDFTGVSILAFVQDPQTLTVHQSFKTPTVFTDAVHAAFRADATVGAAPMTVFFEDLSTPQSGSAITAWEWDLDGDGLTDATDPEPSWTYAAPGVYTVSLTVTDGTGSHTSTRRDYVTAVGSQAAILVVNGIEYATYGAEMEAFYDGSAAFGSHQVDVWDLFGDQGFDYAANSSVQAVHLLRGNVPDSVLRLYDTVVWVGNNYGGDLDSYSAAQALAYVQDGGNFILATRLGGYFFDAALRTYCGVQSISSDKTVTNMLALDPELADMPTAAGHTLVHYVVLSGASEAVPIFRDATETVYQAGFRVSKEGDGTFVYLAGRPYRYGTAASAANYDVMLGSWLINTSGAGGTPPGVFLARNVPNPFNPSTEIRFALAERGRVALRIYDTAGRLVRTLVDGVLDADAHVATWDGRDDAGGRAAAGVYHYRLETGDRVMARSMVMVK